MASINNHSIATQNTHDIRQGSKAAVIAKFLLVTAIAVGLAVAAYFSVIGMIALVAASAPLWQMGLLGIGAFASVTGFFGSIYFSGKYHMFEDTGHNLEDTKNFLIGTLI